MGGTRMKYAKSYIDKYFESINEYHSKVQLFSIAYGELEEIKDITLEWIVELGEIMNWQAMSDRSGVWTYYEIIDINRAKVLMEKLKIKNEFEILEKFAKGIEEYNNEELMQEIDSWITRNEEKIYIYMEGILAQNKDWFYSELV